jgi:mutator protein MutT
MTRAAAIILNDGQVALIERERAGMHYYVFPGGGVEAGETPDQTAVREVGEELGLAVRIRRLVAKVLYTRTTQYFYLAEIRGGVFGAGTGDEMTGQSPPEQGTYKPVWLPLTELNSQTIYPRPVVELLLTAVEKGWPAQPVQIHDQP